MSASKRRPIAALGVALVGSLSLGCHDSTAPPGGGVPSFNHVFIVVEENTDYASVIGSSSMPYLNGLAQQYGLATQYYADTHPSIGNYFMMTVGKIITNDDNHGGGRIAWIAVSGKAKPGYRSTTLYQHASTLRLSLEVLGVTAYPNAAATAPEMDEFFKP